MMREPYYGPENDDQGMDEVTACNRGSLNVRFAPKATELLRRREMQRCARKRHRAPFACTRNRCTLIRELPAGRAEVLFS